MERDGDAGLQFGHGSLARRPDDGAVAVGEFDAAGAVPHQLDDAGRGADFVGMTFLDGIHRMNKIKNRRRGLLSPQ